MSDATDSDEGICLPSSTSITPSTSGSSSLSTRIKTTSKMPSQASTPRLRTMTKWSLQDAFAKGLVKDSQMLECLGTQRHEHAIGELELNHRKLKNKAIEKQHQWEQHEFHMMQMRMICPRTGKLC